MNKASKGPGRPRMTGITPPQRNTLKEIAEFASKKGYPPTIQELAEILGISHASAHEQVSQLVRKGYLRREARKARGIAVVREPEEDVADLVAVPIVGRVAAGQPILAVENIVGEVLVEERVASRGRCFALQIEGDSMIGAGIHDGDLVVVRQQPVAENGDIVVALLDDEATVKILYVEEERVELRSANAKYAAIRVGPEDNLSVLGKVVAARRSGASALSGSA